MWDNMNMPKRVKQRSTDINESAFALVQRSTQEPEQVTPEQPKKRKKKPPSAISEYMAKIGSKGGRVGAKVRAEKLSSRERSEIAHKAAKARWDKAKNKGGLT
jgi:hypothetical protein